MHRSKVIKKNFDGGPFLPAIMDRVACEKHKVPLGVPCFHIRPSKTSIGYLPAICNSRAVNAGFVGKINSNSLHLNSNKRK